MAKDGRPSSNESSKNAGASAAPSASQSTALDGPSQEETVRIPDEWAMPWSNALLRQRIEEREKEPWGRSYWGNKCHE